MLKDVIANRIWKQLVIEGNVKNLAGEFDFLIGETNSI